MDQNYWVNKLSSKIIKDVKIEIALPPSKEKICLKCNQNFSYQRDDEVEIFFRQFASLKKGNLDLCFNCDEMDDKLKGAIVK